MILLLCYLFPPLAVLLMGKPFSAILNCFLTMCLFWIPGIKHALVCYADYKSTQQFGRVVDAINYPAHVKASAGRPTTVVHNHYHGAKGSASSTVNPYIGMNGTRFQRKP
jgi:uncharacterized membrane protein YqaE (UPF0057 family)